MNNNINVEKKNSWLLKNRKRLRFYSKFRTFILKNAGILGNRMADNMINCGYLIKNSDFFNKAKIASELTRESFYKKIINEKNLSHEEITYLEFGVYKGQSFKYWLENNKNQNSVFCGFDTFSGLPEDWGHIPKGHFDTEGNIPFYDDNRYEFYKGLFQDTLPEFLKSNSDFLNKRIIVNFDADLYSSTLYVLLKISRFLNPGDILIFDEFFSVVNASTEFRAFLDFNAVYNIEFDVIAKTANNCAFEIK